MDVDYKVLDAKDAEVSEREQFAQDVMAGFDQRPKRIPVKYHYDKKGSELFRKITRQDEYYLTDAERDILRDNSGDISDLFKGQPFHLVELGSGDGRKTNVLIDKLLARGMQFTYMPIDISEDAMAEQLNALRSRYGTKVQVQGLVGDWFDGLVEVGRQNEVPNLVLFLGSSIGNYSPQQAQTFLQQLWLSLNHGDRALMGFDLKKDPMVMESAYKDSGNKTRDFNLNVLERMNRELRADFNTANFRYHCCYNPWSGAVDSWLISTTDQTVHVRDLQRTYDLETSEAIHVESSHKFSPRQIKEMASRAGFETEAMYYDRRNRSKTLPRFVDALRSVSKQSQAE